MTLTQDDAPCVKYTENAIKERIAREADEYDHFNFNCNQFSGLKPLMVVQRPQWKGGDALVIQKNKPMLKLEQILGVLRGNTLHWLCWQDIFGQHHVDLNKSAGLVRGCAGYGLLKGGLDCFSPTVQAALEAALALINKIEGSYNSQGSCRVGETPHKEGTFVQTKKEGTVTSRAYENFWAVRNKGPINSKALENYLGTTRGVISSVVNKARTGGIEIGKDRDGIEGWRKTIREGISALLTEPQGNPFITAHARAFLERNLVRADNFLGALKDEPSKYPKRLAR